MTAVSRLLGGKITEIKGILTVAARIGCYAAALLPFRCNRAGDAPDLPNPSRNGY